MTRIWCLGTAKCIIFNIYLRSKETFEFSFFNLLKFLPKINRYKTIFETFMISRDWEGLEGTTTLHGRLDNNIQLLKLG